MSPILIYLFCLFNPILFILAALSALAVLPALSGLYILAVLPVLRIPPEAQRVEECILGLPGDLRCDYPF